MASGNPQQHEHLILQQQQQQQQQEHQQQQQQQHHHQQQQQNQQMQFATNQSAGLASTSFDLQSQQQMHQHTTMSPNAAPMSLNHTQGHLISMNPHQQQHHTHHHQHQQHHQQPHHHHHQQPQQQQQPQIMATSGMLSQTSSNLPASHLQAQQQQQTQLQQKSQILPLLLSPSPSSLTPNSNDQAEHSENDHEQIIDQVISLENDFSDTSAMLANVDSNTSIMLGQQHQQQHLADINLGGSICMPDSNQFSSSSEDLLNLLLEFDREPSNLLGLGDCPDQDEKVGIENIRKQLMSCEVQSEQSQLQNSNSMSPIVNQMACQPQPTRTTQQQQQQHQSCNNIHQQQVTQQLISQTAPVMTHHQHTHQLTSSGPTPQQQQQQQHQQISSDQNLLHDSYSNVPINNVPVSSSGQLYAPQQLQQHVNRISQSTPKPIANSSPSPSWQQAQLSPYSPQASHNNPRTPSQRQGQQHHPNHPQQQHSMQQQHQLTTSPPMQQLHHTLQRSPSQSVSPPATTEPSPVVKKNPLLNAQLVNTRAPSITPTRFLNNQTNVCNQNPILNAKLSQNSFTTSNMGGVVGSPVNPNLNPQSRFIQHNQQASNFNFDMAQQQHNVQHSSQQSALVSVYNSGDQQQQSTSPVFRSTSAGMSSSRGSLMGNTSPSGGLSQQVKQEIRRKVQQPKQQQQTTSLLKQLLSDDNK